MSNDILPENIKFVEHFLSVTSVREIDFYLNASHGANQKANQKKTDMFKM